MSEIQKYDHGIQRQNAEERTKIWQRNLALAHKDLWAAVLYSLGILEQSGIIRQRESKFSIDDPVQVAFYVQDCLDLGVTAQVLADEFMAARRAFKFWPTPTEFAQAFAKQRAENGLIPSGQIGYRVDKEGCIFVCDRRQFPGALTEDQANEKSREILSKRVHSVDTQPKTDRYGNVLGKTLGSERVELIEDSEEERAAAAERLRQMKDRLQLITSGAA